jgi:hypothetical protein
MIGIPDNKKMKLALNLSLTLFALFTFDDKTFSLTNYQISKICKKEKKVSVCIKKFQKKRDNLKDGILIEIPVIPYEGN